MKKATLLIKTFIQKPLQSHKGVAMIMAVFAMVITVVIATEIAYETQVEYVAASQKISRLKAYYAAKSGVELSLFRILLYKKALAQFGSQLKDNKSLLDPIWQIPFSWPPIGLENLGEVDKDQIQTLIKESTMDAQYIVSIESEGGKIDINDLGSENEALAKSVRQQLLQIFTSEVENNKTFRKKYENFDFEKLINNVQDWVDEDTKSISTNGDESLPYEQPEGMKGYRLPPNAPFKTLSELHMVSDMEDEIFDLIKDKITVYGTKGINVNYAPESVLRSLDPQIKDRVLQELVKRRGDPKLGGPFKNDDDFYNFLESQGVRTAEMKKSEVPLLYDAEHNFRIVSGGLFSNVRREITAVTYDIDGLTTRYAEMLQKIADDQNGSQGQQGQNQQSQGAGQGQGQSGQNQQGQGQNSTPKIPKGRPTVVFWLES